MDFIDGKEQLVEIFHLVEDSEKTKYESILNDPTCTISRDEFTYDRTGRPIVTI